MLWAITACSDTTDTEVKDSLELVSSFSVSIPEPSGLAINNTGTFLYTVSDNTAKVYKLSLTGDVVKTFNYQGNDLEGVSVYKGNELLLAEERTKEIVVFDMLIGGFTKHKISYDNSDDNSGIEGVTFNSDDNSIFILNEKDPGLLIRLRSDFSIIAEYNLDFALDYSGIFYDKSDKSLWIVSDQKKTINKCSLTGKLIKSYPINVTQAEGIAMTNSEIFVISDATSKLYVYKKPIE